MYTAVFCIYTRLYTRVVHFFGCWGDSNGVGKIMMMNRRLDHHLSSLKKKMFLFWFPWKRCFVFFVRSPFFIFFQGKLERKICWFFFLWAEIHTHKTFLEITAALDVTSFSLFFKSPICWAAWCLSRYPHSSLGYKRGKT